MNDDEIKEILRSCVEEICRSAPYGYGLFAENDGMLMVFDNSVQRINKRGAGAGIILNAWNGRHFEEYVTTIIEKDHLIKNAVELGKRNRIRENSIEINAGSPMEKDFPLNVNIDPRSVSLEEKLARVREMQQRTKTMHPSISNSIIRYLERREHSIFVNPAKTFSQTIFRLMFRVEFIASFNGRTDSWMTGFNGTGGFGDVQISDNRIEAALKNLIDLLSADPIDPGVYDAIVDPETAGVIAHEAFGHGVENDVIHKNRSKARQYIGKPIGSELVNMVDNPLQEGAYGFYHFDDEGNLAQKTKIIENGILMQGLSDQYSAVHLGVPDFGNGRRENFKHKPYARMSNTFFQSGDTPVDEMIRELEDGLYIMQGTNGMEDPKNWGIQCEAKMARQVKNGKFTGKNYAPIGLSGYVPDLLSSITRVGNQFQTDFGGTCIKGYKEHVPVSVGGAHVRIRGRIS